MTTTTRKNNEVQAVKKGARATSLTQCDQVGTSERTHEDEKERFKRRLERYSEAKLRSSHVHDFILRHEPSLKSTAAKMGSCGSHLVFRKFLDSGQFRLISGITCDKHLLCPLCAIRRSAKQYYKYKQRFELVQAQNPNLEIVMFTLTVKNREDLSDGWQHLYESMKKLLQKRRNAKKGKTTTILSLMDGAVWSYEVTNRGKGWHPHIHGIGLIPKGIDPKKIQAILKQEWQEITEDSYQLKVEFPHSKDDQTKAFFEVFKYALKASELSVPKQVEVFKTLQGRRFTASFGSLYGVKIDEDEQVTDEEFEEYIDIAFKFNGKRYVEDQDHDFSEIHDIEEHLTKENGHNFNQRKGAIAELDSDIREPKWADKINTWMKSKDSKTSSLNTPQNLQSASVPSVNDTKTIGQTTNGCRNHSKHVESAGINTTLSDSTNNKKNEVKHGNQLSFPFAEGTDRRDQAVQGPERQREVSAHDPVGRRDTLWGTSPILSQPF